MKAPVRKILFWTPRVLGILMALFISLFAMDVFGEGYSFWETLLALMMHLVPTYLLVIALVVAWRWEWAGGILLIGLGGVYIFLSWSRFPWFTTLIISGPLILTGILFLAGWRYRAEIRSA